MPYVFVAIATNYLNTSFQLHINIRRIPITSFDKTFLIKKSFNA